MILLTGAAGFIGSCMLKKLNVDFGDSEIVIVDDFSKAEKINNYSTKKFSSNIERNTIHHFFSKNTKSIELIIHLGARTDTTEFNWSVLEQLNLEYSKMIWNFCAENGIPLIYASSAATYGMGEFGYRDSHSDIEKLQPLNPYGKSKNEFDKWVLQQTIMPPYWVGLKFFNVYGPNEYHKGRMASVIFHAYHQILETGKMKLFRSHRTDFEDGKQLRDFIYVKDVVNVISHLARNKVESGIYNLGTGKARTFIDLAQSVFNAMNINPVIEFVDTPADIREKYQYFTEADMEKLKQTGCPLPSYSLEEGSSEYVNDFLSKGLYF